MEGNTSILIVGAGPTGLMMACELARFGIPFRIIDKKKGSTLSSNATWIQPRTLELFDKIGIIDRFLKLGHPCHALNLYAEGNVLTTLTLNSIDSIFPFILMLPQSETERLLVEYLESLGIKIERNHELINVKLEDKRVKSIIQDETHRLETITSDWLIACDGANSIIRETCGFHFPGEDLKEQFIVADAKIDFSYMSKDEIHLFFDTGTILGAFPLGSNKYRIIANLHLDYPRKTFTSREVVDLVQERAHGNYYVTDVEWISQFWIHGKLTDQMRFGPIFLAGDAAHIHSPAAGQGMNTGLQDAINLAWKLAYVIQNKAQLSLLDSYDAERYPVVKHVVEQNEYFTKMALFDKTFITKLKAFSQKLEHDPVALSKEIGEQITQLDVEYRSSPIVDLTESAALSIRAGERAPDVELHSSIRLYQYFQNTFHNVLIFFESENIPAEVIELKAQLEQRYPELLKIYFVSKENKENREDVIIDKDNILHRAYHIERPTIFVIRPDGYIGYASTDLAFNPINQFLNIYLIPTRR